MASIRHPRTSRPHLRTVSITGVGSYLPARVLTNAELEQMVETSNEWITSRTGIKERRMAAENEATSDLAFAAAQRSVIVEPGRRQINHHHPRIAFALEMRRTFKACCADASEKA